MFGCRQLVQFSTCLSKVQFNFYSTMMTSLLVPPPSIRGQNYLDHEAFKIKLKNIPCIYLPCHSINKYRNKLQNYLLKFPNWKPIKVCDTIKGQAIIYLDPRKISSVSDEVKNGIIGDHKYHEKEIQLSYDNWPCDEVLHAILPEHIEVPTSYSRIGHIIHLNLKDEQLPYKHVIAQVFLDKIANVKTIVNKLNIIDNTYRNFAMEIIAGEDNTIVSVKETGCMYNFDFAKVYWNPRLSTEHATLVKLLNKNDVLYDIFAGVGPFAIPAALKGVRVLANDLNPESYKWLIKNAELNKTKELITAFNKDGRDFLNNEVKKDILDRRKVNASGFEHLTMNLPALAIEFLDIFPNWLSAEDADKVCLKPPTIHLYCFIKAGKNENLEAITKQLIQEKLGVVIPLKDLIKIQHVRNVAPCKEMMRISFRLTKEILKGEEPAKKKVKLTYNNVDPNFLGNNGKEQVKEEKCI